MNHPPSAQTRSQWTVAKVDAFDPVSVDLASLLRLTLGRGVGKTPPFPFGAAEMFAVVVSLEGLTAKVRIERRGIPLDATIKVFAIFGETVVPCMHAGDGVIEIILPKDPPTMEQLSDPASEIWSLAVAQAA